MMVILKVAELRVLRLLYQMLETHVIQVLCNRVTHKSASELGAKVEEIDRFILECLLD